MNTQNLKTITLQKKDTANTVDVQNIFRGNSKITLCHQGARYTLQITSNNKLLLTK